MIPTFRHNIRIIWIVVAIGCSFGAGWYAKEFADKPIVGGIAPFGKVVATDVISMSIDGIRIDTEGAIPYTPRMGYEFVIPMITITNLSATTTTLIPSLSFYLKDENGEVYNTAVAPLKTGEFGGPMLPHDRVRQEMAFEVKKGAHDLTLYFMSGGQVIAERLGR